MTDPRELPLVLRVEEVAKLLCVSRSSAYEAIKRGQIPAIRVGRRLRVPRAALERLLSGQNEGRNAPSEPLTSEDATANGV